MFICVASAVPAAPRPGKQVAASGTPYFAVGVGLSTRKPLRYRVRCLGLIADLFIICELLKRLFSCDLSALVLV